MIDHSITLEDRYHKREGRVLLTGIQAIVRLALEQVRRDRDAGHHTAGYITGYRGSPLGGLDQQLARVRPLLEAHDIVHQPAVNEELAATACQGTQQAALFGEGRFDGVFALWYGKGPGVDRSGDAIRHGNLFGTAPLGGVLLLLGDDHLCESSTTAHQSEYAMVDAMVPVLNPSSVEDILRFGLLGLAMSRYSGAWVALKCVHDTVESTQSLRVAPDEPRIVLPEDGPPASDGVHIRWPDHGIGQSMALAQERRLHTVKLELARAFARANGIDRLVAEEGEAGLLLVTCGKSHADLLAALDLLDLDPAALPRLGVRLYKVGLTFPLDPVMLERAVRGVDRVLVIEEKRPLVEDQMRTLLYGSEHRPLIEGKRDRCGAELFPSHGALALARIALAVGRRIAEVSGDGAVLRAAERIAAVAEGGRAIDAPGRRLPWYCPGCPHNTSTLKLPEGARALAGIGCHFMVQWMDPRTATFTQMGGEGASWLGQAPFSRRRHVFQNMGDGTFFHSGSLAVRAAVAAGVDMTFKLLFNDAVAMTGGQKMETASLSVPQIARLLEAEGVAEIAVVTDEPGKYPIGTLWPRNCRVYPRSELAAVQERLQRTPGVTVLIYDQTCAAELRRRRKRGRAPKRPYRVVIHEEVCEGCGDCGRVSNCVGILPVETPFGTKRRIDQSACNTDYSCLDGFCPSFVTVEDAEPRAAAEGADPPPAPPPAAPVSCTRPYGIVIAGIGGTGVVTVAALLAMAAHLEGKAVAALDMIGLAQKGGAVVSFVRIGEDQDRLGAPRVADGRADLVLGFDLLVAAGAMCLPTIGARRTRIVVNEAETVTGAFTRDPEARVPVLELRRTLERAAGDVKAVEAIDALALARERLGDTIGANLLLVGYAYQKGWLPLSAEAIERAIQLNGVMVDFNLRAFAWGRALAADPSLGERRKEERSSGRSDSLDDRIAFWRRHLTAWQNAAWAERFAARIARLRDLERRHFPGREALTREAVESLGRLMSYKDEYEVARLFSGDSLRRQLAREFRSWGRIHYHLAPPLLAARDPRTGRPQKARYGPWMGRLFPWLARLRVLRGTPLDPFGWTRERREERALITEFEELIDEVMARMPEVDYGVARELLALPQTIRGFGPVKQQAIAAYRSKRAALMPRLAGGPELVRAAE